ncbi:glycoside hydrolase family 55 protein [Stipitochalara longipes BDJ]|nr:glycoside hydrolase family 55 protein [Stipitochalara longipes BDJ]
MDNHHHNGTTDRYVTPFPAVNETVAKAAALVAEADAAELASQGKLFKDYTFTGDHAKFNIPGIPTGSSLEKRAAYYWLPDMAGQYPGNFPYGGDSSYKVFRSVQDPLFGAKGDGVTDDTAAINAAIAYGNRCANNCGSSSVKGALVYFPPGTYLVSSPIISLYGTQLVGNPNNYPVILAAPSFSGLGVISSDVYTGGNNEYYLDTNNFFRQIRYLFIDMSHCTTSGVKGIHWQVAQATSIENVVIYMDTPSGSSQIGIYAENGSGGFMSDIIFVNGYIGMQVGNQQFTTKGLNFLSTEIAIWMLWDWGWTWKSIETVGCNYGIYVASAGVVGGTIYVLDSSFTNTAAAVVLDAPTGSTQQEQFVVSLDNVVLSSVTYAVFDITTSVVLNGGSTTIASWVIGKVYDDANPNGAWFGGKPLDSPHPSTADLRGGPQGGFFEKQKPSYSSSTHDYWLIAQALAKGDGVTDDTASLSLMFALGAAYNHGVFVPTGSYVIASPPLLIPINSVIVGANWAQFVASGSAYSDMNNPQVMIKVGNAGDVGNIEIQDVLFTVKGATQGAVLVEWNAKAATQGSVGIWDSHFRIGGALGSNLQAANCPTSSTSTACIAASLSLHVTSGANGYFENVWDWTADHDMDSGVAQTQINIFSGRGILVESQGPTWFYGTASEHSVLYQYNLASAQDIYMGMIQTESPYYPPLIIAPAPFTSSLQKFTSDPTFSDCSGGFPCSAAWGLTITNSNNIQITGAGLYSFYQNYNQACVGTQNCQQRLVATNSNGAIYLLNLYTIGSIGMVHPFVKTVNGKPSSTLALALAASNTINSATPYVAAINAWVEIFPGW